MDQVARPHPAPIRFADDFLKEVLNGLALHQKAVPCRFFYDAKGSELFERITELPEYYPTRTEIALLKAHASEIASFAPTGSALVEFGSGSSRKTGLLLEALEAPRAYIPIEISAEALYPAAIRIGEAFPALSVHPILGGFQDLDALRLPFEEGPYFGFFPGSTIGNLTPAEAVRFLKSARRLLGEEAFFLIGADLQKSPDMLLPAYNDPAKVTAAFNLNILMRINRELGGTFDPDGFEHEAIYNQREGRVEMYLRSKRRQRVFVAGRPFSFEAGETIHTENSYKYTVEGFRMLAEDGGWRRDKVWIDKDNLFSLHLLK